MVAMLGAGVQARLQLQALALVRPIREARIWGRDVSKAGKVAQELSDKVGLPVVAHAEPTEAVRGSHIIVTATPADQPILSAAWLESGQHVTAMGSDAERKNEDQPCCDRPVPFATSPTACIRRGSLVNSTMPSLPAPWRPIRTFQNLARL